jgi:hypothetical protein
MTDGAELQLCFDADAWGSLVSFEPGIPVQIGGTLELTFAEDVDVAAQVGRTLHIFEWTGVSPVGEFQVTAPLAWDLSNLYSTGEVRLIAVPGDFDGDNQLTVIDVNALANAVLTTNQDSNFDLTGDGSIDLADHAYWIHTVKHTTLGDTNLDATFDSGDLVQVFQAGQYEDIVEDNSSWETGDWNADGDFTSSDLVAALQDGGYEYAVRPDVMVVPEPGGVLLALTIVWVGFIGRRTDYPQWRLQS